MTYDKPDPPPLDSDRDLVYYSRGDLMPIEPNGELSLSFWKGMSCWGCILLWMCVGTLIGVTTNWFGVSDGWCLVMGHGFNAFFGIVPILFFRHEAMKLKVN